MGSGIKESPAIYDGALHGGLHFINRTDNVLTKASTLSDFAMAYQNGPVQAAKLRSLMRESAKATEFSKPVVVCE